MPLKLVKQRPDLAIWRPEHRGTDGVTLREFSARIAAFCDEIVSKHLGERVAVISHAGTIDAALRWALGITPTVPWMHEFECLANASITEIEFWPNGRVKGGAPRYAAFRRVGDVAHLGGLITDI
jgi:broad specificity phosphatase PhoE